MTKNELILSILKGAFNVNGTVEYVKKEEAKKILLKSEIMLVKMDDKERGVAYIARVIPK